MVQYSDEAFSEGVEIIESDNIKLRVYSLAMTIADSFNIALKLDLMLRLRRSKRLTQKIKSQVMNCCIMRKFVALQT